jgi:MinD superfamily P-loop ATPase
MRNIRNNKKEFSGRPVTSQRRLLVSLSRTIDWYIIAKELAEEMRFNLMLTDGTPGLACLVIASIAGGTVVLIVTEPTLSSRHDMDRMVELADHFEIPASMCINICDLNRDMTVEIE